MIAFQYIIMINDHVHGFDNERIYEWKTDLLAVMNWIVKKKSISIDDSI